MTLRARLALGLAIIALVFIVPIVVARSAMQRLHDDVRTLRDSEFKASLVLGRLRDALGDVRARETALGVLKSDTVHTQLVAIRQGAPAGRHARALLAGQRGDARSGRPRDDDARRRPRVRGVARRQRDDEADSISQNVMAPRCATPTARSLRRAGVLRTAHAASECHQAEVASTTPTELLGRRALVWRLVLATLIALWLTRSISGPVEALEHGMRAVAEGELDHPLALSPNRRDEFGRLAGSFRQMSQQLAELDKLKAEFVSVASHELKTPINVILGYLQLMQDGIYGPLSPKQAEVLGTVEAQGRTLARLAAHLLDVTRFEAGGGRIEPRDVRLATLLDDLERAFHVLAVQREVSFSVNLRPGLPAEAHWDVDRINEVIGNLLANAFKFTPAGGRVELIASPSGEQVRFEVRDTGAGIPPAQLPHIFEKFYQADNQRSASAKGSGLGLAIAKEIVEAHRGTIDCVSTLGGGTTFTLLLPIVVGNRRRTGSHRVIQLEAGFVSASARAWLVDVAVIGAPVASPISLRSRGPRPTAASEWPAALAQSVAEARESKLGVAEQTLTDFAQRFPDSPEAAEVPYWRALYKIDPANAIGATREGIVLLDGYLAAAGGAAPNRGDDAPPHGERLEARTRPTAAAAAGGAVPKPDEKARDDESCARLQRRAGAKPTRSWTE